VLVPKEVAGCSDSRRWGKCGQSKAPTERAEDVLVVVVVVCGGAKTRGCGSRVSARAGGGMSVAGARNQQQEPKMCF
jgi:hypothetical protein